MAVILGSLECSMGTNTKNHDLYISLLSNLLEFLINFRCNSGTGEDSCYWKIDMSSNHWLLTCQCPASTSKASSLCACSHDDMSPAAQSATAALFAAAQDLFFSLMLLVVCQSWPQEH